MHIMSRISILFIRVYQSFVTKTQPFKHTKKIQPKKGKLSDKKNPDIFHIHARNTDRGYPLEFGETVPTSTRNPCSSAKPEK